MKRIERKPNHRRADVAASADARIDAAVKAAYLDLASDGVYPSIERLRRIAGVSIGDATDSRARLVDRGEVPILASPTNSGPEDDPFAEQPDDADADEVKARIDAIRSEKEAAWRPSRMVVTRARYHRPNARPHSRQRIMA